MEKVARNYQDLDEAFGGTVLFDNYTNKPVPYDGDYLDNYRTLANTFMGEKLMKFRKAFAEGFGSHRNSLILDYGCGYSPCCRDDGPLYEWVFSPRRWHGCDVNPLVAKLPHMRGRYTEDPNLGQYDVICFFDVLEHLRNYESILARVSVGSTVVLTVPTLPDHLARGSFDELKNWRHYKPGEHVIYATKEGWISLMDDCGFSLTSSNGFETDIGRLDSTMFAFRKEG